MDIFLPVFCLKTCLKALSLHWYLKRLLSWRSEICRSCTNTNNKKDKSDYRPTSVLSIILKEGIQFVKRVQIRSSFYPFFSHIWTNVDIYSVNFRIQSKSGKIWTRKTPNSVFFTHWYAKANQECFNWHFDRN